MAILSPWYFVFFRDIQHVLEVTLGYISTLIFRFLYRLSACFWGNPDLHRPCYLLWPCLWDKMSLRRNCLWDEIYFNKNKMPYSLMTKCLFISHAQSNLILRFFKQSFLNMNDFILSVIILFYSYIEFLLLIEISTFEIPFNASKSDKTYLTARYALFPWICQNVF